MAKVLRCPACGALWRVDDAFSEPMLRCSECQAVFSADKVECVTVPDEMLDARLQLVEKAQARQAEEAAQGEAAMTKLAGDLEDFESRQTPAAVTAPVVIERSGKSSHGVLWFFLLLIGLAVITAAALLFGHRTVTAWMPQTRTVYEEVCTKLPCPGFVWQNAQAFRVTADIEPPVAEAGDADREMAELLPVIRASLVNGSAYPQRLPVLDLKLYDASGAVMASRVLEPADYGFASDTAVAPGYTVNARLTIKTPLPYAASRAAVTPVSDRP